jgi:hypothetical protein
VDVAPTRTLVAFTIAVAIAASAHLGAQNGGAVPFKLGTFERNGQAFLGLVLRDTQVVDIAQANTAYQSSNASAARLTAPTDMKQLIARYDAEWRQRLAAIAKTVSSAARAPAYVYQVTAVRTLPPVRPSVQLNAGGNQARGRAGQGAAAAATAATSAPGIWERRAGDTRDNPYLFQKSPTVVIGNNANIVVPRGRTNIDFECEFAVVISKRWVRTSCPRSSSRTR